MRLRFPQFSRFLATLLIIGALILTGCSNEQPASSTSTESIAISQSATSSPTKLSAQASATDNTPSDIKNSESPAMSNLSRLEGKATVVITVQYQAAPKDQPTPITIELDGNEAPITAGNFVDLVQKHVYDGTIFHRVVREPQPFVVQGGDPQSKDPKISPNKWGTGGYIDPKTGGQRYIPLEIEPTGETTPIYSQTFESAKISQPPVLRHKQGAVAMARSQMPDSASSQFYIALADLGFLDGNYAVFGYVTQGFEAVNKIQQGDSIVSATVTAGGENFKPAAS